MKESDIREEILAFLKKKGIMVWKDRQYVGKPTRGSQPTSVGVPDIMGVLNDGTFLGIEVKTPEGRISEAQQDFIDRAIERGAMCFVARSLDDVTKRFP